MSTAPARPANAPEIAMARIRFFFTLMPPYAAASGLKPTAFTSYPRVVRLSRTQKTTSAPSAMKIPMSRPWKPWVPQKTGSCALGVTVFDTGTNAWVEFCSGPPSPKSQDAV